MQKDKECKHSKIAKNENSSKNAKFAMRALNAKMQRSQRILCVSSNVQKDSNY